MKRYISSISFLFVFSFFLTNCAQEDFDIPKLECTQPDLIVNRNVEDALKTATITATKYVYDDLIEAYVVSSDQNGNFFKTLYLQTLATENQPAIGFSVSVDATNTYVDYRIGRIFTESNNIKSIQCRLIIIVFYRNANR